MRSKCPRCSEALTGVLPHPCPSAPDLTCYCCHYCYSECLALAPIIAREIAARPAMSFTVVVFREYSINRPELLEYGPLAGQP